MKKIGELFFPFWTKASSWSLAIGLSISQAIDDPSFFNVVRAHFHFHGVAHCDFDKMLSKLARNMAQDLVPIGEFYPEHSTGEDGGDFAFYFYNIIVI